MGFQIAAGYRQERLCPGLLSLAPPEARSSRRRAFSNFHTKIFMVLWLSRMVPPCEETFEVIQIAEIFKVTCVHWTMIDLVI